MIRQEGAINWAMVHVNLATSYRERLRGDRAENIEQAIIYYDKAIKMLSWSESPVEWAMAQVHLATAYRERVRGDRAENIERAIIYYRRALEKLSQQENPSEWAIVHVNLAATFRERIRGERRENLELSIDYYQLSLKVYTRETSPQEWAKAMMNLAATYQERIQGESADNLELAIDTYLRALEIYTRETFPREWAITLNNLASAYSSLLKGDRTQNVEQAIEAYQLAMEVFTREIFPERWASIQVSLANVYRDRILGTRTENLKQGIYHLNRALEIYNREAFPGQYSAVIRHLDTIQHELIQDEFFALWNNTQARDIDQKVNEFCNLLSNSAGIPLLNYHPLSNDNLYIGIFDFSPLFENFRLQFINMFPILFIAIEDLNDDHLERIRQILSEQLGPSNRRAIFIPFCKELALLETKTLVSGAMKQTHAYDIICLSRDDLEQVLTGQEPHNALRQVILSQIDLTSIPLYKPTGATPDNMFFGRERELQEICDTVISANYVLIGGRRIGKTSILKHLQRVRLRAAGFYAYYHDCSYTPTQTELVQSLVSNKDWFPELPLPSSTSLVEVIQALPSDKPLVILFDEADKLIQLDQQTGYPIFNTLRALSNVNQCSFVLCGEQGLHAELSNPNSPLYNFAKDMLIGRLERHAVEELITQPMKQLEIKFADKAEIVQHIWEFTSGHPSVVQSLCQQLVTRLNLRSDRQLTLEDVEAIVSDPNFLRKDFLDVYWERATVLERLCSLVMAADSSVNTLMVMHQSLISRGIEASLNEVDNTLERLVDLRNILKRTTSGYEFAVTAFPQVIAKTHRLDDLIALNCETYQQYGDTVPHPKGSM